MKRFMLVVPFLSFLFFSLGNSANQNASLPKKDKEIIVELNDFYGTSIESRKIIKKQFIHSLNNELSFNYDLKKSYNTIGNLLFLDIPSEYYESIKDIPLVKEVSENKTYNSSYDEYSYNPFLSDKAPDKNYSRVDMNIPTTGNDGAGTIISIIDSSFNISHEMFKNLTTQLRYTKYDIQILKNTSGFVGKNAGYRDDKIPFYYSYGTNNTTMSFTNDKAFHGGHVAGIAAANNVIYGAAPNAQLALMKVTENAGSFTDFGIFSALEDSAILDVDAINMSFGNELVDFGASKLLLDVTNNLKDLGIIVNVSAGNEGKESFELSSYQNYLTSDVETSFLGTFASLDSVNTIGALNILENEMISSSLSTYSGTNFRVRDQLVDHKADDNGTVITEIYDKMYPFYSLIPTDESMITLDYVMVPNYGKIEDYKDINSQGEVAVIERGDNSFVDKIRNAVSNGAIAVLIYNGRTSDSQVGYMKLTDLEQKYYVPVGYINSSDGELLNNQVIKKINVSKELAASYSSDGSTSDLSLKPDISAPGTHVYSGTSTIDGVNNYSFLNGTSMATPNMTGAYANILSNYTGDDSEAYKRNLVARMQSTANPIKDVNGSYYSPRKVGAGEVDVGGAINSDVYLIGNVDNRAKIELKNNEDIKKGDVKLSVETHNGSSESKKYKATVYVQAPELTGVDNTLTNITNYKVKTDKDVLLTSSTSEVTIPAGTSNLSFNVSITNDNKEYLKNFENGTYLEGYVVFDSLDNSEDLSIPYLGFYGDYNKEEAVEPFAFEKDENKLYRSEIINTMCDVYPALNPLYKNADFSSIFAVGSKALTSSEITSIRSNESNLLNYMNQVSYSKKKNKINLGIDGISTHVVIQQFINRNLIDNSVNLINTKTGKVVYSKYLYSLLDGDTGSSLTKHALTKSMMTSDLFSYGIIANRGFLVLDLVDDSNNLIYPEGDYTLEFNYTLVNGSTSKKSYNVTISKTLVTEKPMFYKKEILTIEDKKYLRVYFSAEEIKEVKIEDETIDYSTDGNSYYVYIDVSKYESQKSVRLSIVDIYNKTLDGLLQMTSIDSGMYAIFQESLPEGSRMSASISDPVDDDSGNRTYNYSFIVIDSGNMPVSFDDTTKLSFAVPSDVVVDSSNIAVYEVSDAGIENQIPFSLYEKNIVVETKSSNLKVVYKAVEKETNIFTKPGVIIGISVGVAALAIGAVVMIIVVNKLKKKEVK